jgi:hypothetical protein
VDGLDDKKSVPLCAMAAVYRDEPLTIKEATDLVGAQALAYVANTTPEHITAHSEGLVVLEPAQERALAIVLAALGQLHVRSPTDFDMRRCVATGTLSNYLDQAGTTLANAARLVAGGSLPPVPEDDPVVEALATLARDTYAEILVPLTEGSMVANMRMGTNLFRHPASSRFQQAVLDDEELGRYFVGPVDGTESSFSYMSSTGYGEGGVQLALLADRLLAVPSALGRARAATQEEFIAAAAAAVGNTRRLVAMGRTVRAPALVGLGDLSVPAGTRLETAWGTIRSLGEGERRLLANFAGPGNAVLETEYPVKLFRDAPPLEPAESPVWDAMQEARTSIYDAARMAAFAAVLAVDLPVQVNLTPRFTMIEDPFAIAPRLNGRLATFPSPAFEITTNQVEQLGTWAQRVSEGHHRSLAVAVRRALSAHERIDATDGFIDALIAWDSLFGGGGEGVTFRIALAFGFLLGRDERERRDIYTKAKNAYSVRSQLVHGSVPELDWKEAHVHREAATRLLVEAFRVLYRDRPELIASPDRTADLIVGTADG